MSPSRTPSHQERLRDELERTHAEISQIRDCNDYCRTRGRSPPDHSYRDLEILQSKYAQLSLALEESLQDSSSGHRGRSPFIASHRVASPSDAPHPRRPDLSSLQRPHLSPRPRSSSQDRHRPRDAYSGLHHHSRHSQERYQDRFASSAEPRHSRRPLSRGSPSPKRLEFSSRVSPSPQRIGLASREYPPHQRMEFPSRGSPSPKRMEFASGAGPSYSKRPLSGDSPSPKRRRRASIQSEWDSLLGGPLLKSEWESPQGALPLQRQWESPPGTSPLHSEWDSPPGVPLHQSEWDSLRGIPPLPNDNVLLRGTLFSSMAAVIPELHLVRPPLRGPHRGLRLPIRFHLPVKIRKLKRHLCQPQLRQ